MCVGAEPINFFIPISISLVLSAIYPILYFRIHKKKLIPWKVILIIISTILLFVVLFFVTLALTQYFTYGFVSFPKCAYFFSK